MWDLCAIRCKKCWEQVFIVVVICLTAMSPSEILLKHPECRSTANCRRNNDVLANNEFIYLVNGTRGKEQQVNVQYDGKKKSYRMCCNCHPKNVGLAADDPLPAMTTPTIVKTMEFQGCIVPNITYASILATLNITFSSHLKDGVLHLTELPAEPQLKGYHLKGLVIKGLVIAGTASNRPTRPKSDFLDHLPELTNLELTEFVQPEKEAFTYLPESLVELSLRKLALDGDSLNGGFWLQRLNSLNSLTIQETEVPADFVAILPQLSLLPKLTKVALYDVPLATLSDNTTWLKGSKLQSLSLKKCKLDKLPNGLFERADIAEIILAENELKTLNDAFAPLRHSLRYLDLSDNMLNGTELVNAVAYLEKLKTLIVYNNRLNSLCGDENNLPSNLPSSLRLLDLQNTSAIRICNDWIDHNSLVYLNLDNNEIKNLWYNELEMRRAKNETVTLSLKNNPVQIQNITQDHYNDCIYDSLYRERRVQVTLKLDLTVCDCNAYWLRKMLLSCRLLKADNVACPTTSLFEVDTQHLTCRYTSECPDGCSCHIRPNDNAIVVRCSGALPREPRWPQEYPLALYVMPGTLDRVPRLKLVELHAPYNNITNLSDEDLPGTLRVLDLRNNSIAHITFNAAQQLLHLSTLKGYNVSLAGNPFACGCEDETAIKALQRAKIWDWNTTQCADHQLIIGKTKLCHDIILPTLLGVTAACFILTLIALILLYLRPRIRQFFFDHNCWFSFEDDADDPLKTRDVFISYSFNDYEYAKTLIEKLEEHGYSSIEHCRDWVPGRTISQQITDSVLSARRTLLLVSDNFANSQWGLEEFHVAHAHAMERGSACVIVIRCNLLAPDKLPEDLRLYLCNNTYLDWSDRYFWKKLLQVMPTPRAAQQPPAISELQDKMVQPLASIQLVPSATAAPGLALSRVSLDEELPLSELVLIARVQESKNGSQPSSGQASPVTPVVREPPLPGENKSPFPLRIERERDSVTTFRMPADYMYPDYPPPSSNEREVRVFQVTVV